MKIIKAKTIEEAADKLIEHLNLDPNDTINIMTPQFNREYKITNKFIPHDKVELKAVCESASKEVLKSMGVGIWKKYTKGENNDYLEVGQIHYLFPGEWYYFIPEGYDIIDISGNKKKFKHGTADDDIRFGCLPYGFIRNF